MIYVRLLALNHIRLNLYHRWIIVGVFVFNLIIMVRKAIEFTGIEAIYPNLASILVDSDLTVLDLIK
jgi:hypothetical protein